MHSIAADRVATTTTPRPLPPVPAPSAVVFCDFDETFWSHDRTAARRRELTALIDFLNGAAARERLLFGWVTGSSLERVRARLDAEGLGFRPHFAATDLGTRLTTFDDGEPRPLPEWTDRLRGTRFSHALVADAVARLERTHGVVLRPQARWAPDALLCNHYLTSRGAEADRRAIAAVRRSARDVGVGVNVNRCNPAAGDPVDCFDVDFIPAECGKRSVVDVVRRRHGLPPERCAAFGDSGNDIPMLASVRHGWLVGNATPEARRRHSRVTASSHATGILEGLREFLSDIRKVTPS